MQKSYYGFRHQVITNGVVYRSNSFENPAVSPIILISTNLLSPLALTNSEVDMLKDKFVMTLKSITKSLIMKPPELILAILAITCHIPGKSQPSLAVNRAVEYANISRVMHIEKNKRSLNFFVISKPKKFFDPATKFNIARAKIKSLLRHKKFVCIVAASADEMAKKVEYRLRKYNAWIGSIWFDSHGSYKKGYSFFEIGKNEFNYGTILDSEKTIPFRKLAPYCNNQTRLGIGSCYGGATYTRPETGSYKASRMNGDSLMIGLANLFPTASIFGSESWVMTKPGLFKKQFAMAGYPLRKKFKDLIYTPVWESIGCWNVYSNSTKEIQKVNTVILDRFGNILTHSNSYKIKKGLKRKIARQMLKLQWGLMKS